MTNFPWEDTTETNTSLNYSGTASEEKTHKENLFQLAKKKKLVKWQEIDTTFQTRQISGHAATYNYAKTVRPAMNMELNFSMYISNTH